MTAPTADQLPHGVVVRWRTARSVGIGQIDHVNSDGTVVIRPWLPTKSKEITTNLSGVTVLRGLTAQFIVAIDACGVR